MVILAEWKENVAVITKALGQTAILVSSLCKEYLSCLYLDSNYTVRNFNFVLGKRISPQVKQNIFSQLNGPITC